jgi:tetratricopeptide (TPR) repeat protein/O-antigen ligase
MSAARFPSPHFTRLLQLATTLLVVLYMVFIGGSFDAVVRFRVQLLSTLAGGALVMAWLALRLRQRARIARSGLEWPLLVMAAGQWLAALAAPQPRLSFETAASVTAWAIVFIVLYDLLAQGWPRAYLVNALLLVALLVAVQTLVNVGVWAAQWLKLGQLPPLVLRSAYRPYTSLGNPNLIAIILNLLLPIWAARLLTQSRWPARLAWGTGLLALVAASVVAGSRSGWMVLGVALGLMAGLWLWRTPAWLKAGLRRWRGWPWPGRWAALALAACVVGVGAFALLRPLGDYLLQGRAQYWRPAWLMFLASPLTGGGPGQHLEFQLRVDSIPPSEIYPHAHSLLLETLGSSGVVGTVGVLAVVVAAVICLTRRWSQASDRLWLAALMSGLAGAGLHQLTDHFLGTPSFAFLLIAVSALALAPNREAPPAAQPTPDPSVTVATFHPAWMTLPVVVVLGMTAFALRGAALNTRGVELATQGHWAEAAPVFQQAATSDPTLALYWEHAAQAFTRTGAFDQAKPLWQQAVRLEPRWALDATSLAMLTQDAGQMEAALALAPQSYLLALNAGVLREALGDTAAAQTYYRQALDQAPTAVEALFWQQTPLRQAARAAWQARQPVDTSVIAQGWAAFHAQDFERARTLFEQSVRAAPLSGPANLGLARTALALRDFDQASFYLQAGLNLQTVNLLDTLENQMLRGDLATAQGDQRTAQEAYTWVFSIVNDYTSTGGLGTYGDTTRSWWLFHREGLPSDLIPQLFRADVTPEVDGCLARLAQSYVDQGQPGNACYILDHAHHEAPASESGRLFQHLCPAAAAP